MVYSRVYLFSHHDGFLVAIHIPEHDRTWTEPGLRSMVCAFALAIPQLDVPVVVLHWIRKRVELTLANTGSQALFDRLQRRAEEVNRLEHYTHLAIQTVAAATRAEHQVECGLMRVEYADESTLIACQEVVDYDAPKARPVCARLLDFCNQ